MNSAMLIGQYGIRVQEHKLFTFRWLHFYSDVSSKITLSVSIMWWVRCNPSKKARKNHWQKFLYQTTKVL